MSEEKKFSLPMAHQEMARMNPYFYASTHTLRVLNTIPWVASYSGGKDSTSLVTWIEWLRRTGQVRIDAPRLVQADTEAEYPFLVEVTEMMLSNLRSTGWVCTIVRPPIDRKLYNSIFGVGQTPINPAFKGMRWCTRQTKIKPMDDYKKSLSERVVGLTGVRWGESKVRDGKIAARAKERTVGCNAGGECGLPQITDKNKEEVYGPIITWKDHEVLSWLSGEHNQVERTNKQIPDLREISNKLLHVYKARLGGEGLGIFQRKVHFMRFGCVGCMALKKDKVIKSVVKEDRKYTALEALYDIWDECRLKVNRAWRFDDKKGKIVFGPLKIEARKKLFKKFMDIQDRAEMPLVTADDITFIKQCWKDKVYPGKKEGIWLETPPPTKGFKYEDQDPKN